MLDLRLTEIYHTRENIRDIVKCLHDNGFRKSAGLEKDAQLLESLWGKAKDVFGLGRPAGQDPQSVWGGLLRAILGQYQTRHNVLTQKAPWLSALRSPVASSTAPAEMAAMLPGFTGIPIAPELQQVMSENAAAAARGLG